MGVVGTILGTLGTAFISGRAQQAQYEAQAAQAEANAKLQQKNAEIMAQNSAKAREQAERNAQNNALNAEMQRRQMLQREGQQRARIGASGITASGSAARALADTRFDIDMETAMNLYNVRQQTDKIFGQATDYTNQSAQYQYQADVSNANARDYREAGKRAFWGSMLGGAFSLAGSLYTSNSSAAQAASSVSSGGVTGDYKTGYGLSSWESGNDWLNYKKTGNFTYNNRWNTTTPYYAKSAQTRFF